MAEQSLGMRMKHLRGDARREALSKVVADYEASGLTAAAFCKSTGIATVSLSRWQRELRVGVANQSSAPKVVEVRTAVESRSAFFELTLPTGAVLRVPAGFDEADLDRLLSALRAAC